MKQCTFAAADSYDQLLNQTYKKMVNDLKAAIPQEKKDGTMVGNQTYSEETGARLVTSECAWISDRDANCNLDATEMLGGTGEGLIYGGCQAEATKNRILDLDRMLGSGRQH